MRNKLIVIIFRPFGILKINPEPILNRTTVDTDKMSWRRQRWLCAVGHLACQHVVSLSKRSR